MSVFNVFHIAGSALTAQAMRLNAVASNLANAVSDLAGQTLRLNAKIIIQCGVKRGLGVRQ